MKYENEEQIRKDFARIFGWTKRKGAYDLEEEYRAPNWAEIFSKLGELMSNSARLNDEYRFNSLESQIMDMQNYFNSIANK